MPNSGYIRNREYPQYFNHPQLNEQMTLGQFVAAEVLIVQISNSIEKLVMGISTVFDMLTGVEKLAVVTDLPLDEAKAAVTHA